MPEAAKRPRELSALVATDPAARNSGDRTMIRVRSVVWASCWSSKPGAMIATSCGASTRTIAARTSSAESISVVTVDTTRHARASSSVANSAVITGISAEDRAPAATSWNRKSGILNAAKNGPSWSTGTAAAIATVRT